jgi:transposase
MSGFTPFGPFTLEEYAQVSAIMDECSRPSQTREARERVAKYLESQGWARPQIAETIGVRAGHVSRYLDDPETLAKRARNREHQRLWKWKRKRQRWEQKP